MSVSDVTFLRVPKNLRYFESRERLGKVCTAPGSTSLAILLESYHYEVNGKNRMGNRTRLNVTL